MEFNEEYVLLLEPSSVVFDIKVVSHNDKCRILERSKLKLIEQESQEIAQQARKEKQKRILQGTWEEKKINWEPSNKIAQYNMQMANRFGGYGANQFYGSPQGLMAHYHGSPMIVIRKATKMPDKIDTERIENNKLQIMTPDFEDFASQILHASTRKELNQTMKVLALLKGFKMVIPYGKVETRITYSCHRTGLRRGAQYSKKTNCPFQVIYNKVDRKPNYFLAKYRCNHNHPLDELEMFAGEIVQKKINKVVNELKQHKLKNLINTGEGSEVGTKESDSTSGVSPESLDALCPPARPSYNSKEVQIDALCQSKVYCHIEQGDIVDPIKEGKQSKASICEVLLSSLEYNPIDRTDLKPRRLILETSKILEKDLIYDYFNHDVNREKLNQEEEIKDEEEDVYESKAQILSIENIKTRTKETQYRYDKLTRISEKISPYRIYEVPSDWKEDTDGSPCEVLEELLPTFQFGVESDNEEQESDNQQADKVIKEEIQLEKNEKCYQLEIESDTESEGDNKDAKKDILDQSSQSSEDSQNSNDIQTIAAKRKADSMDISEEVETEIDNDIEGREIIGEASQPQNQNLKKLGQFAPTEAVYSGIKRKSPQKEYYYSSDGGTLYVNDYLQKHKSKAGGVKRVKIQAHEHTCDISGDESE
ncbi:unnamed protein product [Moneuplotes crassus]|uniref:Uncharacterized protein n=1 Tax=Euplotes crassus TaxID=5936 RepID=A0AAD1U862_EUPCR|nr:unnamed protein product [Moneuplotes crassus]